MHARVRSVITQSCQIGISAGTKHWHGQVTFCAARWGLMDLHESEVVDYAVRKRFQRRFAALETRLSEMKHDVDTAKKQFEAQVEMYGRAKTKLENVTRRQVRTVGSQYEVSSVAGTSLPIDFRFPIMAGSTEKAAGLNGTFLNPAIRDPKAPEPAASGHFSYINC